MYLHNSQRGYLREAIMSPEKVAQFWFYEGIQDKIQFNSYPGYHGKTKIVTWEVCGLLSVE